MLGVPQPFKPTLVSDYFFNNDPASPSGQQVDPILSSSPEVEPFDENGEEGQTKMNDTDMINVGGWAAPSSKRAQDGMVYDKTNSNASPPGVGSPTQRLAHFLASEGGIEEKPPGTPPPAPSSSSSSSSAGSTCYSSPPHPSSSRPSSSGQYRQDVVGPSSAPSTAPNSNTNSPFSLSSNAQMSGATSTSNTPSPPPFTLPSAAATPTADSNETSQSILNGKPTQQPQQQQNNTPTSHTRTVAPPSHSSNHHPNHHVVAHSNPTTPPQHQHSHSHSHQPSHRSSIHRSHADPNVEYLGPFILGPVLGRGCTGTVRLGTHEHTKFQVAFKIIDKVYLQTDPKLWAKVKREIVILKLIEHPHVLKLYDVLETENRLYLVLEHVKGGELFDYIVSKGRLDRHEALRIAAQIVMGLEHCHKFSICHRDLKPENLLLDENHNIKICVSHGTKVLLASGEVVNAEDLSTESDRLVGPKGEILQIQHFDSTGVSKRMYTITPTSSSSTGNTFHSHSVTPHHRVAFREWNESQQCWMDVIAPAEELYHRFANMTAEERNTNFRLYKPNEALDLSTSESWLSSTLDRFSQTNGLHLDVTDSMLALVAWSIGFKAAGLSAPSDEVNHRLMEVEEMLRGAASFAQFLSSLQVIDQNDYFSSHVLGRLMTESIPIRRAFLCGLVDAVGSVDTASGYVQIQLTIDEANDRNRLTRFLQLLGMGVHSPSPSVWMFRHSSWEYSLATLAFVAQSTILAQFPRWDHKEDLSQSPFDIEIATPEVSHQYVSFQVKGGLYLLGDLTTTHNCDFGMAQLMKKDGFLKTSCGSPHYAAPEIISGDQYNAHSTDVWSIGVILYALITGSLPFDHDNIPTLLQMVTRGHYTTPAHVPSDIAHLIGRMLTVDPAKRITLPEVRNHICFKGKNYFSNHKDSLSVESMRNKLSVQLRPMHPSIQPHHAHKKHKLNSRDRLAHSNATVLDSDDELEHGWRKTSTKAFNHSSDTKDHSPPVISSTNSISLTHSRSHHSHPLEDDVIDEAVLNDLESLGLGPRDGNRDELRKRIRGQDSSKEPSLEQVFYKLLRQRKIDRLAQLKLLSPKVTPIRRLANRQSSSSSRAAVSGSQPSSAHRSRYDSPMVCSVPTSQVGSTVNSPTGRMVDMSHMIQELTLPPPHPRTSPTTSATTSAATNENDSLMVDVQSSKSVEEKAAAVANTGTLPMQSAIFTGSTLFDLSLDKSATSNSVDATATPNPCLSPLMEVGTSSQLTGSSAITATHPPPPIQHCYSDGSVPSSIMNDDTTAASYYMAVSKGAASPPALQLTVAQPMEAIPPSPSSTSGSIVGDQTEPTSPLDYYDSNSIGPVLPPTSVSANVSPAPPQRNSYQRRMSTPQASGIEFRPTIVAPSSTGVARQLFANEDTDMMTAQQAALDQYARQLANEGDQSSADDVGPPPAEKMTDVADTTSSAPLQSTYNSTSPPVLTLPRVAAPHISVPPVHGEMSELMEQPPHQPTRPRAYSQDETNILLNQRQHHTTDRIVSNVRTPLLTPTSAGGNGDNALPAYSTSPRFHRVKFHELESTNPYENITAAAGSSSSGIGVPARGSLLHKQTQPPPSPQHKKSWFSSVFGGGNFNIFDRLKGKRASVSVASNHNNSSVSSSPSPAMAPTRSTDGIHTKRATLTLSNDLAKLFASVGVQFVHHGSYKFGASYAGATNPPEFHAPPLPPPIANPSAVPLLQRALSTPDENSMIRPRSKSIAVGGDGSTIPVVSPKTPVPSTPKPTPTRTLNQPFIPSSIQYPASPIPSPPAEYERTTSNTSDSSETSTLHSSVGSPIMDHFADPSAMLSPFTISPLARPRQADSKQRFGPLPVRFTIEIFELPGDVRSVQIRHKYGDESTFRKIEEFVKQQLHL